MEILEQILKDAGIGTLTARYRDDGQGRLLIEVGIDEGSTVKPVVVMNSAKYVTTVVSLMSALIGAARDDEKLKKNMLGLNRLLENHRCSDDSCPTEVAKQVIGLVVGWIPHSNQCPTHGVVFADGDGCPLCC